MNHRALCYHPYQGLTELPYDDNVLTPWPMVRKVITGTQVIESNFQLTVHGGIKVAPGASLTIKSDGELIIP